MNDAREKDLPFKTRNFIKELDEQIKVLKETLHFVYNERARLVALIASLFPSSLEPALDCEDDPDFNWIVYIDTSEGQLSWHIAEPDIHLFDHVPRNQGRKWDNHTNDEKYDRIEKISKRRSR